MKFYLTSAEQVTHLCLLDVTVTHKGATVWKDSIDVELHASTTEDARSQYAQQLKENLKALRRKHTSNRLINVIDEYLDVFYDITNLKIVTIQQHVEKLAKKVDALVIRCEKCNASSDKGGGFTKESCFDFDQNGWSKESYTDVIQCDRCGSRRCEEVDTALVSVEQQLTGWYMAQQGCTLEELLEAMKLSINEYEQLKNNGGLEWLPDSVHQTITEHLTNQGR